MYAIALVQLHSPAAKRFHFCLFRYPIPAPISEIQRHRSPPPGSSPQSEFKVPIKRIPCHFYIEKDYLLSVGILDSKPPPQ